MMGHGIGTEQYYFDRDPRRRDLLRQAEMWDLARQAGAEPVWAAGPVLAWGRRMLAAIGPRIAGIASACRRAEPLPRRQTWPGR